ncbi:hypothetical protein [Pseudomonas extremaustralis]|uniref:Uncharacterized protein n=1 Tax=Pseudomonas extremaustralis TaxID=359110 RepID=A0A5C5QFL5_9PSED|nr:hypothetical protein [Pseudomonas extremaustralis]EZI28933.1 hypothetical protein PE143B_0109715 [Pseudomonas extremaustralis 14-3 substr. 14-3b]TWS04113.1 hypothetical protein FIV36_14280 [Pseudomonas extremaustralis]
MPPPQDARTAPVIVGPWPTYDHFKDLPERERWVMYSGAKAHREMLEQAGFVMSEAYDDFVRRVTRELDI